MATILKINPLCAPCARCGVDGACSLDGAKYLGLMYCVSRVVTPAVGTPVVTPVAPPVVAAEGRAAVPADPPAGVDRTPVATAVPYVYTGGGSSHPSTEDWSSEEYWQRWGYGD